MSPEEAPDPQHAYHARAVERALALRETPASGLPTGEVQRRRRRYGSHDLYEVTAHSRRVAHFAPEPTLRRVHALEDAPAQKLANLGTAMGIAGISTTTKTADLVLTNEHFTPHRSAVDAGRHSNDHLIKAAQARTWLRAMGVAAVVVRVVVVARRWRRRHEMSRS